MDARDRYVSLNGMRFHYRDLGADGAPAVLVLHGLNSHSWDWNFLAEPLSQIRRVICLDMRGHGYSDWAVDYTAPRFHEDIDRLLDFFGYESVALFGYSIGGAIAYAYAGSRPERINRLVVVDNAPERTRSQGRDQVLASQELRDRDSFAGIDQAIDIWQRIDPRGDPARIRWSVEHNLVQRVDGTWATRDHNVSRANSGYAPADLYQPSVDERWRLLSQITCPTLIVHAQYSEQFDDDVMQRMVSTLKDGRYVQIPDSGHRVQWDNASALLEAVLPFLRGETFD